MSAVKSTQAPLSFLKKPMKNETVAKLLIYFVIALLTVVLIGMLITLTNELKEVSGKVGRYTGSTEQTEKGNK